MADSLTDLQTAIDRLRSTWVAAKLKLDDLLPAASGPHDTSAHLLSLAEQFGVDATLTRARADPAAFGAGARP